MTTDNHSQRCARRQRWLNEMFNEGILELSVRYESVGEKPSPNPLIILASKWFNSTEKVMWCLSAGLVWFAFDLIQYKLYVGVAEVMLFDVSLD